MNSIAWYRRRAALLGAVALVTGCTEQAPLGPERSSFAERAMDEPVTAASVVPDLGVCQNLQVPAGSKVVYRTYATGVQIYHWNGTSWIFDAPVAVLSADRNGESTVGTHYAGPTWESNSGSRVVAAVIDRCTPDAASIPWLLLGAVSNTGPGIFQRVDFIHRVNTVGGNAPAAPGSAVGEEARVPYTADYVFYRAR